ncbi:unnamed protein product [Arabidopsis halleri]
MFVLLDRGVDRICYVQFPQRFEVIDPNDRYANHNTVFFDVSMRALDALQGPMYVGTGCIFRRTALYGFSPPRATEHHGWLGRREVKISLRKPKAMMKKDDEVTLLINEEYNEEENDDRDIESLLLPKRFGKGKNSRTAGSLAVPREPLDAATVAEAISVISCFYEDKTEWGKRVGWVYGSVTEDERDGYWKMMQKYIGSDVTSMVTLPVIIFEPMTMLQKMAELMEYSHLVDMADKTEDPYMRMVYASSWAISVYYAYQRTWKPFNPILGETYEMTNHNGINFIAELQVCHHPPMSAGHAENEHFAYDCTSKLKTKFLGNVYPVGRTRVTLKRDGVVLDLIPPLT